MPDSELAISVKNLGSLAMPDACLRCFHIALLTGFDGIWERFSPIYTGLDLFTKRHVDSVIDDTGHAPAFLLDAESIVESVKPWRLKFKIPGIDVTVRGEPDAIMRHEDGTYHLIDYKTSKFKGEDDMFLPLYIHQLNAYATILELEYDLEISKMYLAYAWPLFDAEAAADIETRRDDGFSVRFIVKTLEIPRDRTILPDLACMALSILRGDLPKSATDCEDCQRLAEWDALRKVKAVATEKQAADDASELENEAKRAAAADRWAVQDVAAA